MVEGRLPEFRHHFSLHDAKMRITSDMRHAGFAYADTTGHNAWLFWWSGKEWEVRGEFPKGSLKTHVEKALRKLR